jgi:hypothetical protein
MIRKMCVSEKWGSAGGDSREKKPIISTVEQPWQNYKNLKTNSVS